MSNKVKKLDAINLINYEWHDIKECLPKLNETVIVATEHNVFPGIRIRKDGQQFWTNANWQYFPMEVHTGKVLYWCRLPVHPRFMKGEC